MDYTLLGHSGLTVSKYALGTIPFAGTNGFENAGGMTQETANYMVDYALEQGKEVFIIPGKVLTNSIQLIYIQKVSQKLL